MQPVVSPVDGLLDELTHFIAELSGAVGQLNKLQGTELDHQNTDAPRIVCYACRRILNHLTRLSVFMASEKPPLNLKDQIDHELATAIEAMDTYAKFLGSIGENKLADTITEWYVESMESHRKDVKLLFDKGLQNFLER